MITIPKLSDLINGIISDLEATYGDTISEETKTFIRAIAFVQGAKLYMYYMTVAGTQKNIAPDTADPETSGGTLERFGRLWLKRDKFPAQAGEYDIIVTGSIGAVIKASTTFKSDDNSLSPGKLYILDSEHTMITEADIINVRALESGVDSKLEVGNTLTATSPIVLVDKEATVLLETVQPLSEETTEDYRAKILLAIRLESQGGAPGDYILWSLDAQGTTRIYPYAKTGVANEANVFVEATIADSTDGKGTPGALILADVEDVIELDPDTTLDIHDRGRRPMTVFEVHVLAVTIKEIDIEIDGFVNLTAEIQTLILNEMTTQIGEVRPFIGGADILENKNDILDINKIISIILKAAPGSIFGAITLKVDTVSVSSFTFINGDIPHLDSITYT